MAEAGKFVKAAARLPIRPNFIYTLFRVSVLGGALFGAYAVLCPGMVLFLTILFVIQYLEDTVLLI